MVQIGGWSKQSEIDDDLKQFIFIKEDDDTVFLKMGDFKTFAEFLSSLIGQTEEEKKDGK